MKAAKFNAVAPGEVEFTLSCDWLEPEPISSPIKSAHYPLDALPATIREAVREVQNFTQAPVAIVAGVAVANAAAAIQAHIDIERAGNLSGPVSLNILILASSGERKTSIDRIFNEAITEYEKEQREESQPDIDQYRANNHIWESKKAGIQDAIRAASKKGDPTGEHEAALSDLEKEKPVQPKVPRLIYSDATPEALTYSLAKHWPSGAVFSAEAGSVFGSHGMGRESIMRNLSGFNQLWDGTTQTIDRRKDGGSYVLSGARLSMCLQVQPETLQDFIHKNGTLARGCGFFARFLMGSPESTQGTRKFKQPPESWPALSAYHQRIRDILRDEPALDGNSLTPELVKLTGSSQQAWIKFHDDVEGLLGQYGELADIRDIASKAADNVARMAAVFAYFENEEITAATIESAGRVVAWHLNESRRVMADMGAQQDIADSMKLDSWLLRFASANKTNKVSRRYTQQHGPIRNNERLTDAITSLEELNRIQLIVKDRQKHIHINPALLEGEK